MSSIEALHLLPHMMRVIAGITELVRRLQARNTAVYLVSGGFRPIINPIAEMLQIPQENVYANSILHDVSLQQLKLGIAGTSTLLHETSNSHKAVGV